MMGAGKSTVGRALAEITGREFVDTDLVLQGRLGRTIAQVFQVYGEDTFRDHETSVLRALESTPSILSTGGGIVLREENWTEFERLGTTIYLQASLETLIDRLEKGKKKRPLLLVEDWEARLGQLLEARTPIYERAEVTVNVDGAEMDEVVQRVLAALGAQ